MKIYDYIKRVSEQKKLRVGDITSAVGICRQSIWQMQNRRNGIMNARIKTIEEIARVIIEPKSKLLFLSGYNPWANKLSLDETIKLWEFVEILVHRLVEKKPLPSKDSYLKFVRDLDGQGKGD